MQARFQAGGARHPLGLQLCWVPVRRACLPAPVASLSAPLLHGGKHGSTALAAIPSPLMCCPCRQRQAEPSSGRLLQCTRGGRRARRLHAVALVRRRRCLALNLLAALPAVTVAVEAAMGWLLPGEGGLALTILYAAAHLPPHPHAAPHMAARARTAWYSTLGDSCMRAAPAHSCCAACARCSTARQAPGDR